MQDLLSAFMTKIPDRFWRRTFAVFACHTKRIFREVSALIKAPLVLYVSQGCVLVSPFMVTKSGHDTFLETNLANIFFSTISF